MSSVPPFPFRNPASVLTMTPSRALLTRSSRRSQRRLDLNSTTSFSPSAMRRRTPSSSMTPGSISGIQLAMNEFIASAKRRLRAARKSTKRSGFQSSRSMGTDCACSAPGWLSSTSGRYSAGDSPRCSLGACCPRKARLATALRRCPSSKPASFSTCQGKM